MDSREEWRICINFPRYEVSNLGRVKRIKTGRILKSVLFKNKYRYAWVESDYKKTYAGVARLVMYAFHNYSFQETDVVRYRDGNTLNCAYDNLYFESPKEMVTDTWKRGMYEGNERGTTWKYNHQYARECRALVGKK